MVKVTVDIQDNYWLAKPLTAIEKLATEDDTNIDDISSLIESAIDACNKCNADIPPMDDGKVFQDTAKSIQSLSDKVQKINQGRNE